MARRNREAVHETLSGIPVEPLYSPATTPLDYAAALGDPGTFPYTRGPYGTMYRGRLWTMRMFAGFGTADETNARFHYLLEQGQTGLSTAFDMPTLMGYDSDAARALGEVGREGVAIDTLADMEDLFAGIPLDEVTVSMTINAPAAMLLAMYACMAKRRGIPLEALGARSRPTSSRSSSRRRNGCSRREPSLGLVVDMIEWCCDEMPRWHPVSISGYHIREAGATAAQELAFTLADGFAYVEACIARGLPVDRFAPRLSFFFNAHLDFFEEIAKYRAARRIWARELRDRFGAREERSLLMRFHAQTAGVSLTAQQPEVNIVRTAVEALAAVLGGARACTRTPSTRRMALPTEAAATLALRTQQVLAHEVGVTSTADPLGGSWYLEALTDRLERDAYEIFDAHRRDRRRDRGHRRGLLPARAGRLGVPLPAAGRERRPRDRRRQPLRRRRRGARPAARRPDRRGAPDRAARGRAGEARRSRRRGAPRTTAGGCRGGTQRHACARGVLRRVRVAGGDVRRAARRLGRVSRDAGVLRTSEPGGPATRAAAMP